MIHLRIFNHNEEVPKEGWAVKRKRNNWGTLYEDGGLVHGINAIGPEPLAFIGKLMALAQKGNELPGNHCIDCCCARSWEALGIAEYTGKSIPEHIKELRILAQKGEENICDTCGGEGRLLSGVECVCGSTGTMSEAARRLRKELYKIRNSPPDPVAQAIREVGDKICQEIRDAVYNLSPRK